MNSLQAADPCRCPICGQANHCAMEGLPGAGELKPCWCTQERFAPALLEKVPEALRDKACICQACVRAFARAS